MIPAEIQQVDFFRFWRIIVLSHHGGDWSLPGGSVTAKFRQKMLIHKDRAYNGTMLYFEGATWKATGFVNNTLFSTWQMGERFLAFRKRIEGVCPEASAELPSMSLQSFEGSVEDCLADMVHIRLAL